MNFAYCDHKWNYHSVNIIILTQIHQVTCKYQTRPAWAGFKTAEEGRAKIMKFYYISDVITTVLNSYLIQIINKKLYYRSYIIEVI